LKNLKLLRFLIKYCRAPLFEQDTEHPDNPQIVSVGDFIVSQLLEDDLVPEKPVFQTIFNEISSRLEDENFKPERYFIHHTDNQVSQLVSNLLAEKWIESKRWSKAGSFIEKEADILEMLVPRIVNEYKMRKIKEMHLDLERQIGEILPGSSDEELFQILAKIQNLKKIEKYLSDNLGSRAFI
jgi:DNA primase